MNIQNLAPPLWMLLAAAPLFHPDHLEPMVRELNEWIVDYSTYRAAPAVSVAFEKQADLHLRCFPEFPGNLMPAILIKAAYDPGTSTIYLDTGFDPESPIDTSYLLHELVHHHQVHDPDHEAIRHRGLLEGEAYRLQLVWLGEQGFANPYGALGIDEKTLLIIERCPR